MAEGDGTGSSSERDSQRRAREGFANVLADPPRAAALLHAVLADDTAWPADRALALWGLGRSAHDRGEIDEALIVYTEAVALAADTGDPALAAGIRVSWSVCLQAAGDASGALRQLALAERDLLGAELGRLRMQRGFLFWQLGRRDDALAEYDAALALLEQHDDLEAAARLLSNRGIVHSELARFDLARADFERSGALATSSGQWAVAAGSAHNLAYLDGREGRYAPALRGFGTARALYVEVGSLERQLGALDIDECELLLELGLGADAVPVAARVADAARAAGNTAQLAEALLMTARAQLMAGRNTEARAAAEQAVELFERGGRDAWGSLSRYWAIVAVDDGATGPVREPLRRLVLLRRVAGELDRHGWSSEAADVRVRAGRLALAAGRADLARPVLAAAASAQRHQLARVRAGAWHADALMRLAEGDRRGARRALAAGLRAVDEHRASLGAAELRSAAGGLGAPLVAVGLEMAFDAGRAVSLLEWAERGRAGALGAPSASGEDVVPAELRAALRRARLHLAEAIASGGETDDEMARHAAQLEREVSRASRQRGVTAAERATTLRAGHLRGLLGAATIVEYVERSGQLLALVCRADRVRRIDLGPTAAAVAANDHLAFALRRLAVIPPGPAADRAWDGFDIARRQVGALLFGPLERLLGDGPLVVVPTGALHDVLWGALPAAERAHGLAVAPSAAWWCRADAPARQERVLLVAGPGLRHADAEISALHSIHPAATVLTGADATVDAVLHEMAAATLVHIAAHGVFRTDNPLFSTLHLHDGPLFVHELEALPRVPDAVVLAACSSGRSGVLPGDELLGTAAVLMGLGVRTVIAPMLPVADMVTADFAVALHDGLRRELTPAAAIASVLRGALRDRRPDLVAAAASFSCLSGRRA
jgi:tetratricopeptide (TPR) repeat protein